MLVLGNHDGFLRSFDDSRKYDEGAGDEQVTIEAYVMFSPTQIGPLNYKGRVIRTTVITGGGDTETDSMNFSIYVGATGEEVIDKDNVVEISGTVTGTGRTQIRDRALGAFVGAHIDNFVANESFGFEAFIIEVQGGGRIK